MHTLKLTSIGTSTGAIFPKELLTQLKLEKGDQVYAVETPDGILLTPYDPTIQDQLDIGRDFMKKYRDTFKVLAK
jgi:putative addiction module antidote